MSAALAASASGTIPTGRPSARERRHRNRAGIEAISLRAIARITAIGAARPRLWLTLAVLAGTALLGGAASAQNYPWCGNFHDGAGTNCGFSTEAQCRATVMGSGGFCDRNTQYIPPVAPARTRRTPPSAAQPRRQN